MRRALGLVLGVLVLSAIVSADPLQPCGSGSIVFTTLISQGGCEAGDYIFTNFDITSGSIDSGVIATFGFSGTQDQIVLFNLDDGNGFTSNFQLTYNIALDPTASPASLDPANYAIILATAGLQDEGGAVATWQKIVNATSGTGSGSETITDTSGVTVPSGAITGLDGFAFDVTDTFNIIDATSGGVAVDLSNRYTEADTVAEPSTMMLLGGALLGLGVAVRKRRKECV
ncbi:MAG: PEP-CTERM sorting domain-containing protein [Bryobacteraceae bacterium]